MRILSLADIRFPLPRANGIQTMETAWHLAERGHDVTLFVRPDTERPARDPFAAYGVPVLDRLTIHRAPVVGPPALKRAQYLVHALRVARRGPFDVVFTRDLGVASALLRMSPNRRPPVVYESHGYAPVFAASLASDVTGGVPRAGARKIQRLEAREASVWRRAEGYVSTTRVFAEEMTRRHGERSALAVIPNGVRLAEARVFPPAPRRPAVIAYAGHLYPWKGVDVMLHALVALPGVDGLVIGGLATDPDLARARALASTLGVFHRTTFTGLLPPAEVAVRLQDASVLLLPTTATPSARYTSPLKMFEYLSTGRPMIASDLPPIREVLSDGVNARLVPAGDPAALASAIRDLIADATTADRLARRAFDDAVQYAWSRRAERLEDLFNGVRSWTDGDEERC